MISNISLGETQQPIKEGLIPFCFEKQHFLLTWTACLSTSANLPSVKVNKPASSEMAPLNKLEDKWMGAKSLFVLSVEEMGSGCQFSVTSHAFRWWANLAKQNDTKQIMWKRNDLYLTTQQKNVTTSICTATNGHFHVKDSIKKIQELFRKVTMRTGTTEERAMALQLPTES